jgi:hypothetical protein
MQLSCEVCATPLRTEDVRRDLALARCFSCNAVYGLWGRKARGFIPHGREHLTRGKAVLPTRFQVEEDGQSTRISWRWFSWKYLFLAFFCVFWDGFILVWYSLVFFAKSATPVTLAMFLFPLLHVALGVYFTYMTLAGFLNSTRLSVSRDALTIHHGPLPWPGSRTLSGRELSQLYGQEIPVKDKSGRRKDTLYSLFALDRTGRKVQLLTGLEEKDQVLYLEQALERRLGIEDSPVDGEVATRTHAG